MASIVFCEDDPAIQKLIGVAMRATAHQVHIAPDGLAGLALIERERPDLVVTDVAMPGLDGLQLADALKARPELGHIPVVLLTASTQRGQVEQALGRGIDGYLIKPFSPAELRARVDDFLRAAGRPSPPLGETGGAALAAQALLDALPMAAAVLDHQGRLAAVNRAWRRIAEAGDGPALIDGAVGQSYLEACRASDHPAAAQALAGLAALLAGQTADFQLEYPCPGPAAERWFSLHAAPLPNQPGGVVTLHLDVTSRKRAELALAEREREIGRLEGVRLTARELAHRLNNHLAIPLGYLELLRASPNRPPSVQELLDEAVPALEAALAEVDELLQIGQPQPDEPPPR